MLSKLPISKNTMENVSPEANRLKMTVKPKHMDLAAIFETILASSWGAWDAFRGHFGANLSQHKAILSHLGANLRPLGANIAPT